MKTLKEFRKNEAALGQDMMTTLGSLGKKFTRLPMVIWIEVKRSEDDCRHPQLRFANNTSDSFAPVYLIPISISDDPQLLVTDVDLKISYADFEELRSWIIVHRTPLLKYWHGEIDTVDFCRILLP